VTAYSPGWDHPQRARLLAGLDQVSAGVVDMLLKKAAKHSTVHELGGAWTDRQVGRTYKTRCAHVMTGQEGAVLTTREATCGPCLRGGR
jgi:hypothetical protein